MEIVFLRTKHFRGEDVPRCPYWYSPFHQTSSPKNLGLRQISVRSLLPTTPWLVLSICLAIWNTLLSFLRLPWTHSFQLQTWQTKLHAWTLVLLLLYVVFLAPLALLVLLAQHGPCILWTQPASSRQPSSGVHSTTWFQATIDGSWCDCIPPQLFPAGVPSTSTRHLPQDL